VRFYRAYLQLAALAPGRRICDIGGFWGVFAVTLQAIGFDVTMTESLGYYGGAFDPLFRAIEARGIAVVDYDPFAPDQRLPARFDAVTVMAVISSSLRPFLASVGLQRGRDRAHQYRTSRAKASSSQGQAPLTDARMIYESAFLRPITTSAMDGHTVAATRPRDPSRALLLAKATGRHWAD
jgi:hypothetical protein